MSELRPAGISTWKTGLIPRTVRVEFVVERVILPQRSQSHKHGVSPNHRNTKKVFISIFLFVSLSYGLQFRQNTTLKYRPSYMRIGYEKLSRGSLVGIVSTLRTGRMKSRDSSPATNKDDLLLQKVQTDPTAHKVSDSVTIVGSFPGGKADGGMKLTPRFHLESNLRMHGALTLLAHTPSRRAQGQLRLST